MLKHTGNRIEKQCCALLTDAKKNKKQKTNPNPKIQYFECCVLKPDNFFSKRSKVLESGVLLGPGRAEGHIWYSVTERQSWGHNKTIWRTSHPHAHLTLPPSGVGSRWVDSLKFTLNFGDKTVHFWN